MAEKKIFDKMTKTELIAEAEKRGCNIDLFLNSIRNTSKIILKKAESKELDAKTYVRIKDSSKEADKYLINFKDEDALFDTIREIYPEKAEEYINHEEQHLSKIIKHELTPMFLIVVHYKPENGNLRFRAAVGHGSTELAEKTDWDLKKIIEIEIDIGDHKDKSDEDIRALEFLKELLSKIE